jgi:hypothetical protein
MTHLVDRGLDPLRTYRYRIASVTVHGEGLASPPSCSAPAPGQFLPSVDPPCALPTGWRERQVFGQGFTADLPVDTSTLVVVDGHPSSADPRLYEVTVSVAGRPVTVVAFTGGLVQQPIHREVRGFGSTASVDVRVTQRSDPAQTLCLLGVGTGGGVTCVARAPFDPTDLAWLATFGPKADTAVHVHVAAGTEARDLFVSIPLAGQLTAAP